MNDKREEEKKERELALRFRFAETPGEAEASPDPNVLAAYVEGRATEEEAESVERAMLSDPLLVETLRDLRELAAQKPQAVAPGAVSRIRESLRREMPVPVVAVGSAFRSAWSWAVAGAAALILFAGLAGFRMGQAQNVGNSIEETAVLSAMTDHLGWDQYDLQIDVMAPEE